MSGISFMYLELLKILFASLIICDYAPNQRENLVFLLFLFYFIIAWYEKI